MANPALQPILNVHIVYDRDLTRLLRLASADIDRRIASLKYTPGIGAQVRASQLRLVKHQIDIRLATLWGDIATTTQAGRKDAAKAAQKAAKVLQSVAYTSIGKAAAKALVDGLDATAQAGINAAYARVPRELSSRVFHNTALSQGLVHDAIDRGLIQGLNARELAKTVTSYIDPNTPGGVSYAAMRLSRTEINNAYHNQQRDAAQRPGVLGVKWNLSDSHPRPDKCNLYASHDNKLGRGVWSIGKVPDKPHPHCFCFLSYVMETQAQFSKSLAAGKYDDELDRRTKANIARLASVA